MLIKHIKYYLREFIFDWFPKLMKVVLVLCLAGLTALMFSEVWLRYILHLPLLWAEEVVVIPAFWLYMLGASYGSYDRSHIKVEIIDVLVKSENRRLTSHISVHPSPRATSPARKTSARSCSSRTTFMRRTRSTS